MKKTIFVCDVCDKEFDESTTHLNMFLNENGKCVSKIDICAECIDKYFRAHPTEKGGVQE